MGIGEPGAQSRILAFIQSTNSSGIIEPLVSVMFGDTAVSEAGWEGATDSDSRDSDTQHLFN